MPKKTKAGKKPAVKKAEPVKAKAPAVEKDANLLGAVCYLLGILAAVLFIVKKESKFVRFHALQAVFLNLALFASFVLVVGILYAIVLVLTFITGGAAGILAFCPLIVAMILVIAAFVGQVYAGWQAYQGVMYSLPYIGAYADKYSQ